MTDTNSESKILIGLCTYARPRMLKRCLESIEAINVPENTRIECLVVNNHPDSLESELIARFKKSDFHFEFAHCTTKGIPFARNVLLDFADEKNFDYCAFIDDDEIASPDWIDRLLSAAKELNADVLQGQVEFQYAKEPWLLEPWMKKYKFQATDRTRPNSISTCNVLLSKKLYSKEHLGQRFDEFYQLTGGSDAEYFKRVNEIADISMFYCLDSLVLEETPEERCTVGHYFKRYARNENNRIYDNKRNSRFFRSYVVQFPRSTLHILKALLYVVLALVGFFVPKFFRKSLLSALKNLGRTYGALAALFGKRILIYQNITGA